MEKLLQTIWSQYLTVHKCVVQSKQPPAALHNINST